MKQEIITYLSTIKEDIFKLSKFLYDNPEESFSEHKAKDYLVKMLEENKFNVTENFMDIPTAFYAQLGTGHPKICYLCEYDAKAKEGHVTGHNLISSMSIAAGLGLSKVLPKTGGSVIIIGCPGEYTGGSKVLFSKQGVFNDIDVALMVHPNTFTAASGLSMAVLPLEIIYKHSGNVVKDESNYSAFDACLFTLNSLDMLMKGFHKNCSIDNIKASSDAPLDSLTDESNIKLYIRAFKMKEAEVIEGKIKELVDTISRIMNIESEVSIYELPYEELTPNSALTRIFMHNLKESGIINVEPQRDTMSGLSLGNVSNCIPCIQPIINIVEDNSIKYSSPEFALTTISQHAHDKVMIAAQALAFTGLDLIQKEELLQEVKLEHHRNCM